MALIYDVSVLNEYVHQAFFLNFKVGKKCLSTLSQLSVVLSLT